MQVVQPGFLHAVDEDREFGFEEESDGVDVLAVGEEGFRHGCHGRGPGGWFCGVDGGDGRVIRGDGIWEVVCGGGGVGRRSRGTRPRNDGNVP